MYKKELSERDICTLIPRSLCDNSIMNIRKQ